MTLPAKVYFTLVDFPGLSLGNGGDATDDRSKAYDDYAEMRNLDYPVRAFMVEFDPDTNAPERVTEITDEMEQELIDTCAERGLDMEERT